MPHPEFLARNDFKNKLSRKELLKLEKSEHYWLKSVIQIFNFLIYIFIVLIILLLIAFFFLIPKLNGIKDIYVFAKRGESHIITALNDFREKNYQSSEKHFEAAYEYFVNGRNNLDALFKLKLPVLDEYLIIGDRVFWAAEELSFSLLEFNRFFNNVYSDYADYQEVPFNQIPIGIRRKILEKLFESPVVLKSIKSHLNLALLSLYQIPGNRLLPNWQKKLNLLENKLEEGSEYLDFIFDVSRVLPQLSGYPQERTYLLLLQNNTELRPSGGFIGTYGIVTVKDGEIIRFNTKDVYALDNPAAEAGFHVDALWQYKKYLKVNDLFFRDANWSPDFPTTANKLKWFYQEEKAAIDEEALPIDAVIATSPKIIAELVGLFGGIEVDGELFTKENFIKLLEYKVEVDWHQQGLEVDQRKNIIGKIALALKEKIFALSPLELKQIVLLATDLFKTKDLLMYDNDPAVLEILKSNNWTGELKSVDSDYLMIVDANLASLKTDEVVERVISYKVTEEEGKLIATAIMNYYNTNTEPLDGKKNWKYTRLNSYVRFYVPAGSKLISSSGSMAAEFSFKPGEITETEELGKKVFGTYISVLPGEKKSLTMVYELPDSIYQQYKAGQYSLYVQKQAGTDHQLYLNLPKDILDLELESNLELSYNHENQNNVLAQTILSEDFSGTFVEMK